MVLDRVAGTRASSSLRLSPLRGSVCPSLSSTLHIADHLGMGRGGKGAWPDTQSVSSCLRLPVPQFLGGLL